MQARKTSALAGLGLLLAVSIQAQAPQTPPSVTFQVEVSYVDVDAIVTDDNGNFVSGPDPRRLRGLRRRQTAENRDVFVRRAARRSSRSLCVPEPPARALMPLESPRVRRPGLRDRARRPRHQPVANGPRQEIGARFRRTPLWRERSRGGRLYQRTQRRDTGLHQRSRNCCWLPSTSSSGAGFGRRPSKPLNGIITKH